MDSKKPDKKPNYKGFGEHLQEVNESGIPTDIKYLTSLAKKYNTPLPNTKTWLKEGFLEYKLK